MKVSFAERGILSESNLSEVRTLYKKWHGRELEIKNPQRYTEKIQWRKLYDHNPLFRVFCDQSAVRTYIKRTVGGKTLIPLLWRGTNPKKIPLAKLNPPYVIKTTHGKGQLVIVTKDNIGDWSPPKMTQIFADWVSQSYGNETVETGFRFLPRQIFIEKLITGPNGSPPVKRRCFVFHGRVKLIHTILNLDSSTEIEAFHTPTWEKLPWHLQSPTKETDFPEPSHLLQMINLAERLGKKCDHVCVDFFSSGNQLWTRGISVYPWSGSASFKPDQAEFTIGRWWNLYVPKLRTLRENLSVKKTLRNVLRPPLKIHLYSVAWNEEKMLPFFFRHYEPWVDRFFIANHESTDRTLEILGNFPKQSERPFKVTEDSVVRSMQTDGNVCWKQSRGQADWVIVCDIDEFLYHPEILNYLHWAMQQGITLIPATGYQMVSETFPNSGDFLVKTITRGAPFAEMNKTLIFNPNEIREINYSPGHHVVHPTGRVIFPDAHELKLLHYKYLGREYLHERHQALQTRRLPLDIALTYGDQYWRNEKENNAMFTKFSQSSAEVISQSFI